MNIKLIDAPKSFDYYINGAHLTVEVDGFTIDVTKLCATEHQQRELWSATCGVIGEEGFEGYFEHEIAEAGADYAWDWFQSLPEEVRKQKDVKFVECMWSLIEDNLEQFEGIYELIEARVKVLNVLKFITATAPENLTEVQVDDEYRPNDEVLFFAHMLSVYLEKEQMEWSEIGGELDDDLWRAIDDAFDVINALEELA